MSCLHSPHTWLSHEKKDTWTLIPNKTPWQNPKGYQKGLLSNARFRGGRGTFFPVWVISCWLWLKRDHDARRWHWKRDFPKSKAFSLPTWNPKTSPAHSASSLVFEPTLLALQGSWSSLLPRGGVLRRDGAVSSTIVSIKKSVQYSIVLNVYIINCDSLYSLYR